MVYPHKWSPVRCRSSAGQGEFVGHRPTFYRCATQPTVTVDHPILLSKLNKLDLPSQAVNCQWIISYLTGRSHILKCNGQLSEMNTSIVHGYRVGPMLYVVMESDFCVLLAINILLKYADDTSLLVPCSDSDTSLADIKKVCT